MDSHVHYTISQCAQRRQRMYLLKLLRHQGMSGEQLSVVTYSIIVSRILYALPACGGFLSAELTNKINALFRRLKRFGYTTCNITVSDLIDTSGHDHSWRILYGALVVTLRTCYGALQMSYYYYYYYYSGVGGVWPGWQKQGASDRGAIDRGRLTWIRLGHPSPFPTPRRFWRLTSVNSSYFLFAYGYVHSDNQQQQPGVTVGIAPTSTLLKWSTAYNYGSGVRLVTHCGDSAISRSYTAVARGAEKDGILHVCPVVNRHFLFVRVVYVTYCN